MGQKQSNKTCTKCGSYGPFGRDKRHKDGLQSWCRSCLSKATRENYKRNPEKAISYTRKWEKEHPERAKAINLRTNRKYRKVHHAEILERGRKFRANHPEVFHLSNHKYQKEHPEKVKEFNHRRRARKLGAKGNFTSQQWKELIGEYGNRCIYCNQETISLEPDHVIPLSRGGSNDISNIVPACRSCNSSKHNSPLLVWMYNKVGDLLHKPKTLYFF